MVFGVLDCSWLPIVLMRERPAKLEPRFLGTNGWKGAIR
jgi:hypothetical protein